MVKALMSRLLFLLLISPVYSFAANYTFQHWTTDNGVNVHFYPSDVLPMVDLRLVFAAGSARDGDKLGVADMTSALLSSGAAGMDAQTIASRLDSVGAQFSVGSLRDMAWVTLRSLTMPEMLDEAIEVASAVIAKPDFPVNELELMRQQLLAGLKEAQQSPGDIAEKAYFKAIYADHPYGQSPEEEDYKAITQADVEQFYKQYYVARNAQLAIVGNLNREQAEALARRVTAALPSGEKAASLPPVDPLQEAKTIHIDYPSAQSHILIGQAAVARGDEEHLPLYVANHSFGGSGFASILMDEVREKRGLAYSVYSYASPMEGKGPFIIGLQTRNDQVGEAIDVVMENLKDFSDSGPTPEAFTSSVKNITGGAALKTDTNAKIVQYASLIGFYGLPLDYLDRFNARVREQTRDGVHAVFREVIDPKKLVIVVVGGEKET